MLFVTLGPGNAIFTSNDLETNRNQLFLGKLICWPTGLNKPGKSEHAWKSLSKQTNFFNGLSLLMFSSFQVQQVYQNKVFGLTYFYTISLPKS